MMALVEDTSVYPTMVSLRDCLCAELEKSDLPTTCFCDIMPGTSDGFIDVDCDGDDNCGGSAWVRLVNVFPSSRLPEQEIGLGGGTFLAAELEVGVARCITAIDDDGTAPDAVTQHMDTRLILADMAAMRRAISCCFRGRDREEDWMLGAYTPLPGLGGVGGGSWQVYAKVT